MVIIVVLGFVFVIGSSKNYKQDRIHRYVVSEISKKYQQPKAQYTQQNKIITKYCPSCGSKQVGNSKFCSRCGDRIN